MDLMTAKIRFNESKFSGNNQKYNNDFNKTYPKGLRSSSNARNDKPCTGYYWTHCEVLGHNIDRCFNVHGYPANFKGFKDKRVATLPSDEVIDMDTDDELPGPPLSMEQFNQVMSMLKSA